MDGLQNLHDRSWWAAVEVIDVEDDPVDPNVRVLLLVLEGLGCLDLFGLLLEVRGDRLEVAPNEREHAEALPIVVALDPVLEKAREEARRGRCRELRLDLAHAVELRRLLELGCALLLDQGLELLLEQHLLLTLLGERLLHRSLEPPRRLVKVVQPLRRPFELAAEPARSGREQRRNTRRR